MPSIEQHVKELAEAVHELIHTLKHQGVQMVDAVADMKAAVAGALDEITAMVAAIVAAPKDDTAALEGMAKNLNDAVAAAKVAVAPTPVAQPVPGAGA